MFVPNEWGQTLVTSLFVTFLSVSIQLVSPTSGDRNDALIQALVHQVSIQLVSPTSGDS